MVVREVLPFCPWCFLFLSPASLRGLWTNRRETLPQYRKMGALYRLSPKIRGRAPQKMGPKHAKFRTIFYHFRVWSRISGTGQDIENRKDMWSRALPRSTKKVRRTLVHYLQRIPCEFGPTKMDFWRDYISALRGCCHFKILHELDIDPGYLTHTPRGQVPKKL